MQNESEIRGIKKKIKEIKSDFFSRCFDCYLKTQVRGTGIENESRNDLDRLKNFYLCQFSTVVLALGSILYLYGAP